MKKFAFLALAVFATMGASAQAASVDDTFRVSLEIRESCTLSAEAADLDFGQADRSSNSNLDSSGVLRLTCTLGTPWTLSLDNGQNGEGVDVSYNSRRMVSGTDYVAYGLYHDAARTEPFGNVAGVNAASGTGIGAGQSVSVYGRVSSSFLNIAAGSYEDIVRAELTY